MLKKAGYRAAYCPVKPGTEESLVKAYEEAARIYRYLLDQTPDRSDLRQALAAVTSMLPDPPGHWDDISGLIERWVRLMVRQNALRRLKKMPCSITAIRGS